ncbi:MAG: DUF6340 family protein [Candidatus Edwardsbacteria bacterium]
MTKHSRHTDGGQARYTDGGQVRQTEGGQDLIRLGVVVMMLGILSLSCVPSYVMVQVIAPGKIDPGPIKRVAILDFNDYPSHSGSGRTASSMLLAKLVEPGYYQLIERAQIDKVMQELALGQTGVVDESTAKQVGKILGVDAVIFGSVTSWESETRKGTEKVKKEVGTGQYQEVEEREFIVAGPKVKRKKEIMKEVLVDEDYLTKNAVVSTDLRMVNIETGQVVAALSETEHYSKKASGASEIGKVLADEQILNSLLGKVIQKFVAQISPHYVMRSRRLMVADDEFTKRGNKLAQNGLWDEAKQAWQQAVSLNPQNAAAHNNLGIAYEKMGKIDQAEQEYQTALNLAPGNAECMKNLREVRELRQSSEGKKE